MIIIFHRTGLVLKVTISKTGDKKSSQKIIKIKTEHDSLFDHLKEKLQEKFAVLKKPGISMILKWKDKEGDEMNIDDSDDLETALDNMKGGDYKFWVVYQDEDEKGKRTRV